MANESLKDKLLRLAKKDSSWKAKAEERMRNELSEIVALSQIHPLKVRNVYIFGSRVYGYNRIDSDYDVVVVAPTMDPTEHKGIKYNVHVVNPDKFAQDVKEYQIRAMECIFAPEWAKVQEKMQFSIVHDPVRMKQSFLTQSSNMWQHARFKMNQGDVHRALKSIFHAMKVLSFGIQIVRYGKIIDFSECNDLHKEVMQCEALNWKTAQTQFIQRKKQLEQKLRSCYAKTDKNESQ